MRARMRSRDRGARRAAAADRRRGGRGGQGVPALAAPTTTSRSSATASTSSCATTARPAAGVRGVRPRDPPRQAADAVHEAHRRRRCELAPRPQLLVLTKANSRATVHRPRTSTTSGSSASTPDGEVDRRAPLPRPVHDRRLQGSAREIPLLRGKVERVLERAGFPPDSHDAKALARDPRDLPARLAVPDRRRRAVRRSRSGSSGSGSASACACSSGATRSTASSPASSASRATASTPRTASGSARSCSRRSAARTSTGRCSCRSRVLVRVHYIVHCTERWPGRLRRRRDRGAARAATRAWTDDLREALIEEHGEERGTPRLQALRARVPAGYRADWVARVGGRRHRPDRGAGRERRSRS